MGWIRAAAAVAAGMNYRHAFHAGNFADCVKHAVLVWLLRALQRKPAPLFVLDTHAGAGRYDLDAGPAARTGEWRSGHRAAARRSTAGAGGLCRAWCDRSGLYPGSPADPRALLRPDDRLACCELHPEDAAALRRHFAGDRQVAVHHRDAWEALGALLPPKERRGLVLIDPPFEDPEEFAALARGLAAGWQRFRTGVFAAWYPIKQRAPVRQFLADMQQSGMRDVVAAELCLREPVDPARLNGCGMLVVNPPYRFEQEVAADPGCAARPVGRSRSRARPATVRRIADE